MSRNLYIEVEFEKTNKQANKQTNRIHNNTQRLVSPSNTPEDKSQSGIGVQAEHDLTRWVEFCGVLQRLTQVT